MTRIFYALFEIKFALNKITLIKVNLKVYRCKKLQINNAFAGNFKSLQSQNTYASGVL